jgi:hypothetical protein
MLVMRSVIESKTLSDALSKMTKYSTRDGYAVMMTSACEKRAMSVEAAGGIVATESAFVNETLTHTNLYTMLSVRHQSSAEARTRSKCLDVWRKNVTRVDTKILRDFLGDSVDCPMWNTDMSRTETVATILADSEMKKISLFSVGTSVVGSEHADMILDWNYECTR